MGEYHRLTREERYQIQALRERGSGVREMSRVLGRSASTISREMNRNTDPYRASHADSRAKRIREMIHRPYKLQGKWEFGVQKKLRKDWSPEQIAGRLLLRGAHISHETIYQFVYRDRRKGGDLWKHLRHRRRWRRSRKAAKSFKNCGKQVNRKWIDERPEVVIARSRLGDYERDLMLGKRGGPVLLTLVDRTSRLTKIAVVKKINAFLTHQATVALLKHLPVATITNDNGPEFSMHDYTAHILQIPVFFSHPYRSWERGTNENTNGLIRTYFPKGTDLTQTTKAEIQRVEDLLNRRPRKCLGFQTPVEVHKCMSRMLH